MQLECLVGTGKASGYGPDSDLAGTSVVIQVNLKAVAADDPVNDPTAKDQGTSHALKVDTSGKGMDPAVSIISTTFPADDKINPLMKDVLPTIIKNYFNDNIGEFNHVFSVMNINEIADKDGFQWLKPAAFQYAVASPENATVDNSAFGVIAMVQGDSIGSDMQQAVDVRALASLPSGANSAFVISEHMVAKNMLLRSAVAVIQGSTAADFAFSTDGKSVYNVNDVVWGNFQTAKNGVISPKITANNFTMRADDTYIYVEIANAEYETSPGVTVHMNLTQQFTYSAVKAENGNYYFLPDTKGLGNPNMSANVSLSEGLQISNIVIGAVAAVAGVLAAGAAVVGALTDAISVTTDAVENTGVLDLPELQLTEQDLEEVEDMESEASISVDEGIGNSTQAQTGGMLALNKFKLVTGVLSAVAGATAAAIPVAKAVTQLDYDNLPAFDDFAANALGATGWPGLSDYRLVGASFRTSLVMALAMDAENPVA